MLEIDPMRRKEAADVLHTSLVSGHITTTVCRMHRSARPLDRRSPHPLTHVPTRQVRREANKEVMQFMAEIKEEILESIDAAEERLHQQVADGNAEVVAPHRMPRACARVRSCGSQSGWSFSRR